VDYITPHINAPATTIYVGIDFGLTPAALIGYQTPTGQLRIIDELTTFNMGAMSFGKILHDKLSRHPYDKCSYEIYGDPAGEQRSQTDEQTPYDILAQQGINAYPTFTNDVRIRREAVAELLTRLDFTGQPQMIVGPGAPQFRKAMSGGYKYKRVQTSGDAKYVDKPDKNQYSHIADAGQYLVLGAIGDSKVIGGWENNKQIDYSLHNRGVV